MITFIGQFLDTKRIIRKMDYKWIVVGFLMSFI